MEKYHSALEKIMKEGTDKKTRNGITRSLFAIQIRFNMSDGFPAITTKKLAWKAVVSELLWFIEGSGDERRLAEILHKTRDKDKKTIWSANSKANYWLDRGYSKFDGDLGRVYGVQWRHWKNQFGEEIDQLEDIIERIKSDPNDRRLIVSAWNPGELKYMALPPCHMSFQFYIADNNISLHMNQRSADMFLGVPFNIASYSLLLHMVGQVTGYNAHEVVLTFNDAHIYKEHFGSVEELLKRTPNKSPQLKLNPKISSIDNFKMEDIELIDYNPQESISAKMIV